MNNPKDMLFFARNGCDVVITDRPDVLRDVLLGKPGVEHGAVTPVPALLDPGRPGASEMSSCGDELMLFAVKYP